MEEKKLTDEEIVKALDVCYNSPCCNADCPYFNKNGRNLCLENKAFYRAMKRIAEEYVKQKAEIERLTEESDEMFDRHAKENQAASILIEKRNDEIAELQKQVKSYQDKIEQGKLIELPCPIGTMVYYIGTYKRRIGLLSWIDDYAIISFPFAIDMLDTYGNNWFLTREEAEKRLKELQE